MLPGMRRVSSALSTRCEQDRVAIERRLYSAGSTAKVALEANQGEATIAGLGRARIHVGEDQGRAVARSACRTGNVRAACGARLWHYLTGEVFRHERRGVGMWKWVMLAS